MTQQPDDYTPRQRSNVPPNTAYDPTQPYAPQQPGGFTEGFVRGMQGPQGWYQPYQAPQPPKKSHKVRNVLLGIVGGFIALIVIAAVASGGKTPTTSTTASSPSTAPNRATQAAAPAVTTNNATPEQQTYPQTVTYACTGSAPDGIDITYGPEGSSLDASHLPFSKSAPLDDTAQYYSITAQLSGSGHVTCATTVQTSDGTKTVKTASASGGYNIAMAEVCESFTGGYDAC